MPRPKGQTLTEKDIVEAAIVLLEREGESALGVNRVARELGIQPPSLYNHITGNEALRQAVVTEGYRRALDFVRQQVEGVNEPKLALKTIAQALRCFAHDNPTLYTVTTNHRFSLDYPEFAQNLQGMLKRYTTRLEPLGLKPDEIVYTIRMLHSAIHGFIQAEQAGLFVFPQSLDKSYEWMLDTLIDGLMHRQDKPTCSEGEQNPSID